MASWLKRLQVGVVDFFFPRQCVGCGKVGDFICVSCSKHLHRLILPLCQKCGKPEPSGVYCPECWKKQSSVDVIRSVFIFEGTIRSAVHALKYQNLYAISGCLGELMARYYKEYGLTGDFLLPVPLHEKRTRDRGYNQSELLAREISKIIHVPVKQRLITRVKDTKPQARTSVAEERRKNVDSAFLCKNNEVAGKNIVVIDDVCTSGATLEACATALKTAGAKHITGFTLAREI